MKRLLFGGISLMLLSSLAVPAAEAMDAKPLASQKIENARITEQHRSLALSGRIRDEFYEGLGNKSIESPQDKFFEGLLKG